MKKIGKYSHINRDDLCGVSFIAEDYYGKQKSYFAYCPKYGGLFIQNNETGEIKQIEGSCQFDCNNSRGVARYMDTVLEKE